MMTNAERALRQLAAAAGYATLARLARYAQIDKHTLYAAVRGGRRPRARTLTKVAAALGVSADVLRRALEVLP